MNIKLLNSIKTSGMKQWQIAKRAGISEVRLSKIVNESGAPPKILEIIVLSKVLNCEPIDLFSLNLENLTPC